ncbi:CHASE3 domain-containing protein [Fulvivirgaceae bacterium PWU5]|uniref:histidine kinase n=1 Tax=Dawidia cretensis TaxID=2782350 RepID=A0AAP2DVQ9_9BACT|nr:ATP-binding protein [Dawidia cretensis]MBT1708156.1 CHASE3 domain-containing protein [Dawidia cretensis]
MKISYTILAGFFSILLLFVTTTFINYRQSELINENSEALTRSSTILKHSNRFQRNVLNMVSGLRGYLLTNEPFFIQAYDSAMHENDDILHELSELIPDSSAQGSMLAGISALNSHWLAEFGKPLIEARRLAGGSDSSMAAFNKLYRAKMVTGIEKNINRSLQNKFREFSNYEYASREEQRAGLTASIQNTKRISFFLTMFSIIAGISIAVFLANYISSGVVKMVRMAESISQGHYKVSMRATGKDELSSLARALNHMAGVLAENISLLKRKNDELDQFAYIVSHDLKAPLRGIDNVVTWIEEDHTTELSPKVTEYLDLIKGRIKRAENLLNGILSYSRVGRELQQRETVDVNQLIEEVRESLPPHSGIQLEVQAALPVLQTEKLPLLQVFTNLITNAYKYHDKPQGYVKVYFQHLGPTYEFYVEDNGPGIAQEYHRKIFTIFQTLEERDSFESTGVGLSIVKKILDDRKLSIRVQSEPGRGATFIFTWRANE